MGNFFPVIWSFRVLTMHIQSPCFQKFIDNILKNIGEKKHDKTHESSLILLERGNKLTTKAIRKSEFLVIAGKPIGEPIARGGPFVMNTKTEILEAIQDYNNGTFAKY